MRQELQMLRDRAERECAAATQRNDRDSADAWERIGMVLDEAQLRISSDWATVERRRPAGEAWVCDAERAADRLSDCWLFLDALARSQCLLAPRAEAAALLTRQQAPGWKS